ncbi:MAG TPA: diacylglycerol kinase family protein [Anaerolineales bacterium]|jgi:YegS/Rv2252/BmrU family lipid kinase
MKEIDPPRTIDIIVNPASGKPEPVLSVLHEELTPHGVDWDVHIASDIDDIPTFVDEAVERGADLLAVYGGDGTVSAAAASLKGLDLPLAILPGGTGNVMAMELSIPIELREACQMLLEVNRVRAVDLGSVNGRSFILRVGIGLEAEMVNQADDGQKKRLGSLAYWFSALAALRDPAPAASTYQLEIDAERFEERAVTCLVINSGNLGRPDLKLAENIRIDDGWLDIVLVREVDLDSVAEIISSVTGGLPRGESFKHWQGRRIRVEASPPRPAEADGEDIGSTPLDFELDEEKVLMVDGRKRESS